MAKAGRVFNSFKRQKLQRKQISGADAVVGLALLAALTVAGLWVAWQKDNFDPGERDISIETLRAQSVKDTLYKTPLERWRDPALGAAPGAAATIDVAPFPAGVVSTGWRAADRVETFDPDNLYEKINGQAEQYLKFGFVRLDVLTIEHASGAAFDLFLYDQGSFANCLGLYQEQRGDKPVTRSGEVLYTPTALGGYGMVGRVFFHLIGTTPDEPVPTKTAQLVGQLDQLAGDAPTPLPFAVLRDMGAALDQVAYTPENVFQYGFLERFWFAAVEADAPTAQLFLHAAESAEEAAALAARLREEQAFEYEPAGEFLRHKYLKTFFSVAQAGNLLFGVSDYPSPDEARAALGRLIAAFPAGTPAPSQSDDASGAPDGGEANGGEPDYGEPDGGEPDYGEPGEPGGGEEESYMGEEGEY